MEDKILELLTKMYNELNGKMDNMQGQINGMQGQIDNMQSDIIDLKKVVLRFENDHGNKLDALFDGYKQNSERLDRIEAQVSRQEEFIIKRVK